MANERVELIIDGSGALRALGQVEAAASKTGKAVDAGGAAMARFEEISAKFNESMKRGAGIMPERVAKVATEVREWDRLGASIDRTIALEIKQRREAARAAVAASNAVLLGHASQAEAVQRLVMLDRQHAAALADARTKAVAATAANQNLARSLQQVGNTASISTANIAAQFQDIGVTAAMGMSPLMIALQQGTQLSAVLNTMQSPLRGLAAAFGSIINPTSLLTIGFVALGAAAVQWFVGAEEGADKSSTALERHRKWIDSLLAGYNELAQAAREAGEAASSMPAGIVELELTRGLREQAAELEALMRNMGEAGRMAEELMEGLSLPSAPMRFGIDRDQMGDLRAQIASLQDMVLAANATRAELEAAAVAAGKLYDATDNAEVQDAADNFYKLAMQLLELRGRSAETEVAIDGLGTTTSRVSMAFRDLGDEISAFGKIAPVALSDVARAAQLLDNVLSRAISMGQVQAAVKEYEAAMGRIREGGLEELARREREVIIGGLSDRAAATTRILDDWEPYIDGLRKAGHSSEVLAKATALMNEAIRQSGAHFDEIERKAGEKGAAKAVKALDTEMARFVSTADRLVDDWFPAEGARREAEELLALLQRFPNALDDVQRAAVNLRVDSLFQAAALGVRELDRTTETSGDNIMALIGDIGQAAAGIFQGAKESVWDWVDAPVTVPAERLATIIAAAFGAGKDS